MNIVESGKEVVVLPSEIAEDGLVLAQSQELSYPYNGRHLTIGLSGCLAALPESPTSNMINVSRPKAHLLGRLAYSPIRCALA